MWHYGRSQDVIQRRQQVLEAAYQRTPERFVGGLPKPQQLPEAVWINPPKLAVEQENPSSSLGEEEDAVSQYTMIRP
jgi:hypothetical protein